MTFSPLTTAELPADTGANLPATIPEDGDIGSSIRALRLTKGMTQQQLAQDAGISIGYLSQIERNRSRLPIGVARIIADALGVHLHWFFSPSTASNAAERAIVVRHNERRKMSFPGLGISEELLSPSLDGPLEMLLSSIAPGADSGDYTHQGFESGYVIEGVMELWVDGTHMTVSPGDSFAFSSTSIHRIRNPGDTPTRVLWVITPPHY